MSDTSDRSTTWADALRRPWTALCAAAAVVLGPAASTASALMQANAAPCARRRAPTGACDRRSRPAAQSPRNLSHSRG